MAWQWTQKKSARVALSCLALLAILALGYWLWDAGLLGDIHTYVRRHASLPLFLALLALLPVTGFPLSLLLVVAGARLGIFWGIVALALTTPIHLLLTWLMSRALERWLVPMLQRRGHRLPRIPENKKTLWVAMFSLVPGLSYAVKNLTLTLGGTSLGLLMGVAWPVQVVQGVPLVLVGGSVATGNLTPLFVGVFLLLLAVVGTPRLIRAIGGKDADKALEE